MNLVDAILGSYASARYDQEEVEEGRGKHNHPTHHKEPPPSLSYRHSAGISRLSAICHSEFYVEAARRGEGCHFYGWWVLMGDGGA